MRKNYRYPRRDAKTGFSVFIIVIILAVAAGYAGTKYIIYPYLMGNNPVERDGEQDRKSNAESDTAVDVIPSSPSIIIDRQNLKNGTEGEGGNSATTGGNGPYSVQFGSFTTKNGAEILSEELTGKGIYSYVYESGGSFKVLGLPYTTEEKAREAASIVSAVVSDAFVVNLSELIQ